MKINGRTKWIAGGISATAAIAAAVGILGAVAVHATPEKELFVVKTWTRKDCSVTPWTVADRLGFLKAEGIQLVTTGETQAPLQIPSILRGDNDVATAHPNTIAVAKAGGAAITGVAQAGIEPTDPKIPETLRHMWYHVNPEKHPEIETFQDLKKLSGKIKVAVITNNICQDFEINLLADKYGIPREKFEWVTMPDVQAIQALKQGLIDLTSVHPPFYKGMADAGMKKIADTFEVGLGAAAGLTYYYFRDEFIQKHPKEVAAFVRAMVKGQQWANANPEKAQQLTEQAIGVPVTGNHYYSETFVIDESLAKPWIEGLEKAKVIPAGKVTTATLVTHEIERLNLQQARN